MWAAYGTVTLYKSPSVLLKIQVVWDFYTGLTGKLLTTIEEHNVPIIRVKQSRGSHNKTHCVDTDEVMNQTECHYHKPCTALVELVGKLRDKDHGSDVRSINKGMDYRM